MDKKYLYWSQIDEFVFAIKDKFKDKKFTGVYGPPRGGCMYAVMLSHLLQIPMLIAPIDGCLIVDDICDTGAAMHKYNLVKEKHNYTIATMCYKPQSTVIPDFYFLDIENETWVVFPWEFDET